MINRLKSILSHVSADPPPSFHLGATEPPLLDITLAEVLHQQAEKYPDTVAVISAWQGYRWTYKELEKRTDDLARGFWELGLRKGDRIAILAGNCGEYVLTFFAAAKIGAIIAVINPAYSEDELRFALRVVGIKIFVTIPSLNKRNHLPILKNLLPTLSPSSSTSLLPTLQHLILIDNTPSRDFDFSNMKLNGFLQFKDVAISQRSSLVDLESIAATLHHHDVINIQFTSGTTAAPKASMLTHHNIINNGRYIGDRMLLVPSVDKICIPPPLFHCFGLVLGNMAVFTHGATVVYASETFNAKQVLKVVSQEQCTGLHGVPTMFVAELDDEEFDKYDFSSLRTGIASGSSVPGKLMERIHRKLNLTGLTICYGMTETSPVSYQTTADCPLQKRIETVGTILPHTKAKVINPDGEIVPLGTPGELCVSGYLLQKGYWENPKKTAEVMIRDKNGDLWMHTGDEAVFDADGYCRITGRIKDIIIRGGENIFPLEIEDRLFAHAAVAQASVVAIKDTRYGEVVGAFIEVHRQPRQIGKEELKEWVMKTLARYKAPKYIFWLGEDGVPRDFPKTASGKIRKVELREIGDRLVQAGVIYD